MRRCIDLNHPLPFQAPEVLSDLDFGCPADVFAYGSVLYEITHGRFPWSDEAC